MDIRIKGKLKGSVTPPPSKSQAHRLLICAALGKSTVRIFCDSLNDDLCATMESLNAIGAEITYSDGAFEVLPVKTRRGGTMPCGESGSTLRFLLPPSPAGESKLLLKMRKSASMTQQKTAVSICRKFVSNGSRLRSATSKNTTSNPGPLIRLSNATANGFF